MFHQSRKSYGNRAVSPMHSIGLYCHHCDVDWGGCAAECCCPECGAPKNYSGDCECMCERCIAEREHSAERATAGDNMSEWQPIETAPRDGTHILAYRRPIGIRFTNLTNPPTVVHWFDEPPGFYTSVNELAPERPFDPTHWMPLPAPPR